MNYRKGLLQLLLCIVLFGACDNPFSYSPFEARVPGELRNTTAKNLQKIADSDTTDNPVFNVALLSDTHYHFNELRDALNDIHARNDIAFIIVTGDITENGLQKEFELFHGIMAGSKIPYLTVIGNHDYLANGGQVYQQIFGPLNYSFTFRKTKFVMWDNVLWESKKRPDWNWFEQTIKSEIESEGRQAYNQTIPFSHIPPYDAQLSQEDKDSLHKLLLDNNVTLSIHGHKHGYSYYDMHGDGVRYLTVGSVQKRAYALLSVTAQGSSISKIEY